MSNESISAYDKAETAINGFNLSKERTTEICRNENHIPMCDRRLEYTKSELMRYGFAVYSPDDSRSSGVDILILPPPSVRFASDKTRFCPALSMLGPGGWLFIG